MNFCIVQMNCVTASTRRQNIKSSPSTASIRFIIDSPQYDHFQSLIDCRPQRRQLNQSRSGKRSNYFSNKSNLKHFCRLYLKIGRYNSGIITIRFLLFRNNLIYPLCLSSLTDEIAWRSNITYVFECDY